MQPWEDPDLKCQTGGVVARRRARRKLCQQKGIQKAILWQPEIRLLWRCTFMPSLCFSKASLKNLTLDLFLLLSCFSLRLYISLITCKDYSVVTTTYARLVDGCVCLLFIITLWLGREDIWVSTGMKASRSLLKSAWNPIWDLIVKDVKTKCWIDIGWAGVLLAKQTACSSKPSFFTVSWKKFFGFWVFFQCKSVGLIHCYRC